MQVYSTSKQQYSQYLVIVVNTISKDINLACKQYLMVVQAVQSNAKAVLAISEKIKAISIQRHSGKLAVKALFFMGFSLVAQINRHHHLTV